MPLFFTSFLILEVVPYEQTPGKIKRQFDWRLILSATKRRTAP